jgi:hypothetical protein
MKNEFDYVYAIVRVDEYQGPECPLENKVTVKQILWDERVAQQEVARLNGLLKEGVRYFSQVTRLEKENPAARAIQNSAELASIASPLPRIADSAETSATV